MGMPALMMSPQAEEPGRIPNDSVDKRDAMYGISSSSRKHNRADIPRMTLDPNSDRWRATGKGFEVDLKEVVMSMGWETFIVYFHLFWGVQFWETLQLVGLLADVHSQFNIINPV